MSWIKDAIDISRNLAKDKQALNQIRSGLRNQARLNHQFLKELLRKDHMPSKDRLFKIAGSLEYDKFDEAINYGLPFTLISSKRVTLNRLKKLKVNVIVLKDKGLEEVLERVYLKTAYILKDYDNPEIDLYRRLYNLAKYNLVLLDLLR